MNQLTQSGPQEVMIQTQLVDRGIRDPRVIEAFRSVPRDRFFLNQFREEAFADSAAPIGHGQTISQPYIVALMTQSLALDPRHRVLELGTGSGYQTAILARLAGEIWTIERVKPLLDTAWERLMDLGLRNIHYRHGDGTNGWPDAAPFDRILIAAAAPRIPENLLLGQLVNEGRAIVPVGGEADQMLTLVTRRGNELEATDICPCRFVKLIGEEGWQDEPQGSEDKGSR